MTIGNMSVVQIRHNLLPQLQVGVVGLKRTEELAVNEKVPLPRIDDLGVTNSPDFLRAEMETDLALVVTAVVAIVLAPVVEKVGLAPVVEKVGLAPLDQMTVVVEIELDLVGLLLPQMVAKDDVTVEIAVHLNQDVGENKVERNKYFCIFVLLLA